MSFVRYLILVLTTLLCFVFACSTIDSYRQRSVLVQSWNPFEDATDVLSIWKKVSEYITYKLDEGNIWQSPRQTYELRTGDCEDINLLFLAVLRYRGYDAELVVGSTAPEETTVNHAWVVLRLNGVEYYCDATRRAPNTLRYTNILYSSWTERYRLNEAGAIDMRNYYGEEATQYRARLLAYDSYSE